LPCYRSYTIPVTLEELGSEGQGKGQTNSLTNDSVVVTNRERIEGGFGKSRRSYTKKNGGEKDLIFTEEDPLWSRKSFEAMKPDCEKVRSRIRRGLEKGNGTKKKGGANGGVPDFFQSSRGFGPQNA